MAKFLDQLTHGWNRFINRDETERMNNFFKTVGGNVSYGRRPDAIRSRRGNDKSMLGTIINRIAVDASAVDIKHVRLDENDQFTEVIRSKLNHCLTVSANIDQAARFFKQDIFENLCDKGNIAIVPIDTTGDPYSTQDSAYDIESLRVGEVVDWMPRSVDISVYNDYKGVFEVLTMPKDQVALVENPFYKIMNDSNSTLQRLIRKLNLLDHVDEQSSSGKLDIIIQLPYVIKSETRKQQAEQRRKDLEEQMAGSKYGVAYADGTERITQLNRPAENNLLNQVQYLTERFYAELGLPKSIFEGSASGDEMVNYYNRTIEPLLAAVTGEMKRTFLTKTAVSQKQSINFIRDPFKLMSSDQIAEMGDKMTRNEILTRNEFRGILGRAPHKDEKADQLYNSNVPQADPSKDQEVPKSKPEPTTEERSDPSKWDQNPTLADGQQKQE